VKKYFIALVLILLPILVFAQSPGKKKAYYFFGEQCPHCKTVDEYFQANGIYDKYEITKLEVAGNPFNSKLFLAFGKAFGSEDWGGVPAIVFADKYLVGDRPIIDNFVREIEAAQNAGELPDPEKMSSANDGGSQQPVSAETSADDKALTGKSADGGNKKNYSPVIVIALVAVGTGALIYVNRKKQ